MAKELDLRVKDKSGKPTGDVSCPTCLSLGEVYVKVTTVVHGVKFEKKEKQTCPTCNGKGTVPDTSN